MNDLLEIAENPKLLEIIEGLLDVTIEREKEIVDLTVEVEMLKKKMSKYDDGDVQEHKVHTNTDQAPDILVANGNEKSTIEMIDLLIKNGCKIVALARDGFEAIDLYKKHHPILVFIETHLPGLDGYKTTKNIKEFDPDARVIIISRIRDRRMVLEAIMSGASDYICRPFTPERLIKSVERLLAG